jgi:hypothetical protein
MDYTSGAGYQAYITDGGSSEAVAVTGGSTGSGSCSITFTPFFSHTSYTIGSASSGIQETINAACGTSGVHPYNNSQCNVTIPANGPYLGASCSGVTCWSLNNYNVYGTIFFHSNQSVLSGFGVSLNCLGRAHCLEVGDQINANDYTSNTVQGFQFRTPVDNSALAAYNGCAITQTQTASATATITTATSCGFRPGDIVTIQFTDSPAYWGDAIVATASGTSFTFSKHNFVTTAAQTTPGVVALAYDAILDNGQNTHFQDISYDNTGAIGSFNNFFDFWDDENALVEHFTAVHGLTGNVNWTGAFLYSGGGPIGPAGNTGQQWAPVITLRDSSITAQYSNGVTVDNSNGLYIENTVIQASGPWQVKSSNIKGNYQGAYLKNIYSESTPTSNPSCTPGPCRSPFPGTGTAGLIAGGTSAAGNFEVSGGSSVLSGGFLSGGSGATPYTYYIVANCSAGPVGDPCNSAKQTSPMQVLNWLSTGSDSVPVTWPRVASRTSTITYDVIRMTTPSGVTGALPFPYVGGCPGGAGGACGYVAFGLSQATACGNSLICTYADVTSTDCGVIGSPSTCAYTVKIGNYSGQLNFWPGSLVSVNKTAVTTVEQGPVVGIGLNGGPSQVTHNCSGFGQASPGGYTTCLASITTANNSVPNQTATILTDGVSVGGGMTLTKGRLNFSVSPFATIAPHHIITLIDSQPALTKATSVYRPPANANDVWIGTDVPRGGVGLTLGQLAFGAPVSISSYIRATGDGIQANWLERLTSTQKTFKVPVRINEGNSFTLGNGSPLSQMRIYSVNNVLAKHVLPQSCVDLTEGVKGLTKSDQITSITPPGRLGNLSLSAYASDEGAIVLHFCNPSSSEATTPPGAYSFLAVH